MSPEQCPLKEETQQRVIDTARRMGYLVNFNARALASGRTMTIGLLHEGALPLLYSVYHDIVENFSASLHQKGYHLGLFYLDEAQKWRDAVLNGRVDGCVALHKLPDSVALAVKEADIPTVLINGQSEYTTGIVNADDYGGSVLAVDHLLKLGHRAISMVVDTAVETPHYSLEHRRQGFYDTMAAAGVSERASWIEGDADHVLSRLESGAETPTAIICYSHFEAVPLLRALQLSGRSVPRDISLVSFNDVFPLNDLNPSLTAVAMPAAEIGLKAANLVLSQISSEAEESTSQTRVSLKERLVVRESTARVFST